MSVSIQVALWIAVGSVVLGVLDPLWVRIGRSYWRFTPMLRRVRLSPRLRTRANLETLLHRTSALWGCPIEWRRSASGIEFHGRGLVNQWLGCGRIVDPDGDGWLSVEFPFRQHILVPLAFANVLLAGPLGWPVAAGLMLSVVTAFLVQQMFARRFVLVARSIVAPPSRAMGLLRRGRYA